MLYIHDSLQVPLHAEDIKDCTSENFLSYEKDGMFNAEIKVNTINGEHRIKVECDRREKKYFQEPVKISSITSHFYHGTTECSFTLRSIREVQLLRLTLQHLEKLYIQQFEKCFNSKDVSLSSDSAIWHENKLYCQALCCAVNTKEDLDEVYNICSAYSVPQRLELLTIVTGYGGSTDPGTDEEELASLEDIIINHEWPLR